MTRHPTPPRLDWQQRVESQGLHFHTDESGAPYWDESAYYHFTAQEIDAIEKATYALDEMCLSAVQYVIDENLFPRFDIPPQFVPWIVQSWDADEFTLYGRFDLAFDGHSPPKLLEYNADTPTSLLEASVIQWHWMQDKFPTGVAASAATYPPAPTADVDQFNSLHEKLIEAWKRARPTLDSTLYFSAVADHVEDFMTATYLRDTALQAGLDTQYIHVHQLGWNPRRNEFVDMTEQPIRHIFKLYPWEWMVREQFAPHLLKNSTRWLEPPWKMLLSNKAILPILYTLFPDSPYLLEASFDPLDGPQVRKPLLSREGANITILPDKNAPPAFATEGPYQGPYIYQRHHPLPSFSGNHPVIGSWLIDGHAPGIGIREDTSPVTANLSRFIPHVFT